MINDSQSSGLIPQKFTQFYTEVCIQTGIQKLGLRINSMAVVFPLAISLAELLVAAAAATGAAVLGWKQLSKAQKQRLVKLFFQQHLV